MIRSKVFDVLRVLSKEELKKFGDYLGSPLFNKRESICKLYDCYKKFYPEFEDKNLTKEKIYKKIFSGKKYHDENFRNLNSILLGFAEDFLSYLNYSNDNFDVKRHLLLEINHRKILHLFEKNFMNGAAIHESSNCKDLEYFYNSYDLLQQRDVYYSIVNKFSPKETSKSGRELLSFFILRFMEIQNYILYECRIRKLDWNLKFENSLVDNMIKILPAEIKELPQVQIYYNSLKLEQTRQQKYYENLKQLIGKFGHLIDKGKNYNRYLYLIDYIKSTGSTSEVKIAKELFLLRKEIIEKNLIMENTITNIFFLNIVKSGLRSGEFEWIHNFINGYQSFLIPKYREVTTELSYAHYYFEKKEFDKALSYVSKVRYEDNFYSLEVRNLTARIYYEINNYDPLMNFIASYRRYLSRNRYLLKVELKSHSTFLNFLEKLIRIRDKEKFDRLGILKRDISKNEFVSRFWLAEKVQEFF